MPSLKVVENKNIQQADSTFTVKEYSDLISKTLESSLNGTGRLLRVQGILGELKNGNNYPDYYTTLTDPFDKKTIIETVIPKTMVSPEDRGAECIVHGFAAAKNFGGKTSVQIKASSVEFFEESDDDSSAVTKRNLLIEELLNISRPGLKEIPGKINNLFVIYPRSGIVFEDFNGQLVPGTVRSINARPTAMTDPADITRAIAEAAAVNPDIVAIIRGGGNEFSFAALSDPDVARNWAELKPFKISALGHTENRTLIDYISDVSLNVPADAGRFLANHTAGAMEKEEFLAEIKKQAQEIGSLRAQLAAGRNSFPKGNAASYDYKRRGLSAFEKGLITILAAVAVIVIILLALLNGP